MLAGLVFSAMAAFVNSSGASTPSRHIVRPPNVYVLRHPKREHCKAHYARRVVRVKKRIHGHTKKVRETLCVRVRRKPASSAPSPQPVTPSLPALAPAFTPTPVSAPAREPKPPKEPKPGRESKPDRGGPPRQLAVRLHGSGKSSLGALPQTGPMGCLVEFILRMYSSEYSSPVMFSTNVATTTELGGVRVANPGGITLQGGPLTLANSDEESLINNVTPGSTAVTLDEGVTLELTGKMGGLGGNAWNGPGLLEIEKGAELRTGECAHWAHKETRCGGGTPTPAREGLQVRNLGTIWGAGISLCRNKAAQPAKLENEGHIYMILSGGFGDASDCGEVGSVVNGERGSIGLAQLDGDGCNVRLNIGSFINKGLVKLGSCDKSETEEVQRPKLELGSSLSEAGTIIDNGIIEVHGDYTPTGSSNLTIGIRQSFPRGSPETNYGTMQVSGSAILGGVLNIENDRYEEFPLNVGEEFQILDVGWLKR